MVMVKTILLPSSFSCRQSTTSILVIHSNSAAKMQIKWMSLQEMRSQIPHRLRVSTFNENHTKAKMTFHFQRICIEIVIDFGWEKEKERKTVERRRKETSRQTKTHAAFTNAFLNVVENIDTICLKSGRKLSFVPGYINIGIEMNTFDTVSLSKRKKVQTKHHHEPKHWSSDLIVKFIVRPKKPNTNYQNKFAQFHSDNVAWNAFFYIIYRCVSVCVVYAFGLCVIFIFDSFVGMLKSCFIFETRSHSEWDSFFENRERD